jgi:hypothetical protein
MYSETNVKTDVREIRCQGATLIELSLYRIHISQLDKDKSLSNVEKMAREHRNYTSHIILYFALSGIMTPINSF